jgi:hypothetical protein
MLSIFKKKKNQLDNYKLKLWTDYILSLKKGEKFSYKGNLYTLERESQLVPMCGVINLFFDNSIQSISYDELDIQHKFFDDFVSKTSSLKNNDNLSAKLIDQEIKAECWQYAHHNFLKSQQIDKKILDFSNVMNAVNGFNQIDGADDIVQWFDEFRPLIITLLKKEIFQQLDDRH